MSFKQHETRPVSSDFPAQLEHWSSDSLLASCEALLKDRAHSSHESLVGLPSSYQRRLSSASSMSSSQLDTSSHENPLAVSFFTSASSSSSELLSVIQNDAHTKINVDNLGKHSRDIATKNISHDSCDETTYPQNRLTLKETQRDVGKCECEKEILVKDENSSEDVFLPSVFVLARGSESRNQSKEGMLLQIDSHAGGVTEEGKGVSRGNSGTGLVPPRTLRHSHLAFLRPLYPSSTLSAMIRSSSVQSQKKKLSISAWNSEDSIIKRSKVSGRCEGKMARSLSCCLVLHDLNSTDIAGEAASDKSSRGDLSPMQVDVNSCTVPKPLQSSTNINDDRCQSAERAASYQPTTTSSLPNNEDADAIYRVVHNLHSLSGDYSSCHSSKCSVNEEVVSKLYGYPELTSISFRYHPYKTAYIKRKLRKRAYYLSRIFDREHSTENSERFQYYKNDERRKYSSQSEFSDDSTFDSYNDASLYGESSAENISDKGIHEGCSPLESPTPTVNSVKCDEPPCSCIPGVCLTDVNVTVRNREDWNNYFTCILDPSCDEIHIENKNSRGEVHCYSDCSFIVNGSSCSTDKNISCNGCSDKICYCDRIRREERWQVTLLRFGKMPVQQAASDDFIKGIGGGYKTRTSSAHGEVAGCVRVVTDSEDILHIPIVQDEEDEHEQQLNHRPWDLFFPPDFDKLLIKELDQLFCIMASLQRSASESCSSANRREAKVEQPSRYNAFKIMKSEKENVRKLVPFFMEKSKPGTSYVPFRSRKLSVGRTDSIKRRSDGCDVIMYRDSSLHSAQTRTKSIDGDGSSSSIRLCGTALGNRPITSGYNFFTNSLPRSVRSHHASHATSPIPSVGGSPPRSLPRLGSRDSSAPPGTLPQLSVTENGDSFNAESLKDKPSPSYDVKIDLQLGSSDNISETNNSQNYPTISKTDVTPPEVELVKTVVQNIGETSDVSKIYSVDELKQASPEESVIATSRNTSSGEIVDVDALIVSDIDGGKKNINNHLDFKNHEFVNNKLSGEQFKKSCFDSKNRAISSFDFGVNEELKGFCNVGYESNISSVLYDGKGSSECETENNSKTVIADTVETVPTVINCKPSSIANIELHINESLLTPANNTDQPETTSLSISAELKSDVIPQTSSSLDDAKPQTSSTSGDAKPQNSISSDDAKPQTLSSSDDAKPQTLSSSDDAKPQTPSSSDDAKPQTSTSSEDAKPQVSPSSDDATQTPSSSDDAKPQTTSSSDDAKPQTPSSSDDAKPQASPSSDDATQTPSSSDDAKPQASPSSDDATQTPSSSDDAKPQTPSSSDDAKPQTPSSSDDAKHQSSPSSDDAKHQSSPSSDDAKPQTPSSSDDAKPQTPSSSDDAKPQTPSSSDDATPQPSTSSDDAKPQTFSSSDDAKPQTFSSSDDAKPQTFSSSDDAKPQTSTSSNEVKPQTSFSSGYAKCTLPSLATTANDVCCVLKDEKFSNAVKDVLPTDQCGSSPSDNNVVSGESQAQVLSRLTLPVSNLSNEKHINESKNIETNSAVRIVPDASVESCVEQMTASSTASESVYVKAEQEINVSHEIFLLDDKLAQKSDKVNSESSISDPVDYKCGSKTKLATDECIPSFPVLSDHQTTSDVEQKTTITRPVLSIPSCSSLIISNSEISPVLSQTVSKSFLPGPSDSSLPKNLNVLSPCASDTEISSSDVISQNKLFDTSMRKLLSVQNMSDTNHSMDDKSRNDLIPSPITCLERVSNLKSNEDVSNAASIRVSGSTEFGKNFDSCYDSITSQVDTERTRKSPEILASCNHIENKIPFSLDNFECTNISPSHSNSAITEVKSVDCSPQSNDPESNTLSPSPVSCSVDNVKILPSIEVPDSVSSVSCAMTVPINYSSIKANSEVIIDKNSKPSMTETRNVNEFPLHQTVQLVTEVDKDIVSTSSSPIPPTEVNSTVELKSKNKLVETDKVSSTTPKESIVISCNISEKTFLFIDESPYDNLKEEGQGTLDQLKIIQEKSSEKLVPLSEDLPSMPNDSFRSKTQISSEETPSTIIVDAILADQSTGNNADGNVMNSKSNFFQNKNSNSDIDSTKQIMHDSDDVKLNNKGASNFENNLPSLNVQMTNSSENSNINDSAKRHKISSSSPLSPNSQVLSFSPSHLPKLISRSKSSEKPLSGIQDQQVLSSRRSRVRKSLFVGKRGEELVGEAAQVAKLQGATTNKPKAINFPIDVIKSNKASESDFTRWKFDLPNSENNSEPPVSKITFRSKSSSPMPSKSSNATVEKRFCSSPASNSNYVLAPSNKLSAPNSTPSEESNDDSKVPVSSFINTVCVDLTSVDADCSGQFSAPNKSSCSTVIAPPIYVSNFNRMTCDVPRVTSQTTHSVITELQLPSIQSVQSDGKNSTWPEYVADKMILNILDYSSSSWQENSGKQPKSDVDETLQESCKILKEETADLLSNDRLNKSDDLSDSEAAPPRIVPYIYSSSLDFIDQSTNQESEPTNLDNKVSASSCDQTSAKEASSSSGSNGSENWWAAKSPVVCREQLPSQEIVNSSAAWDVPAPHFESDTDRAGYVASDDDFDMMDEDMRRLEEKIKQFEHELEEDLEISFLTDKKMPNFGLLDKGKLRSSPLPSCYPPVSLKKSKHLSLMSKKEVEEYLDSGSDSDSSSSTSSGSSDNLLFVKRKIELKPGDRRCWSTELRKPSLIDDYKTDCLMKMLSMSRTGGSRTNQSQNTTVGAECGSIPQSSQGISQEIHIDDFKMTGEYWKEGDMALLDSEDLVHFYANSNPSGVCFIFEDDSDDYDDERAVGSEFEGEYVPFSDNTDIPQAIARPLEGKTFLETSSSLSDHDSTVSEKKTKLVSSFKNTFIKATKSIAPRFDKLRIKPQESPSKELLSLLSDNSALNPDDVLVTSDYLSIKNRPSVSGGLYDVATGETDSLAIESDKKSCLPDEYHPSPAVRYEVGDKINEYKLFEAAPLASEPPNISSSNMTATMQEPEFTKSFPAPTPPIRRSSIDAVAAFSPPGTLRRKSAKAEMSDKRLAPGLPQVIPPPPGVPPQSATLNFYPVRSRPITGGYKFLTGNDNVDMLANDSKSRIHSSSHNSDEGEVRHAATSIRQLKRRQMEKRLELEEEERNDVAASSCSYCIRRSRTWQDTRSSRFSHCQRRSSPHPRALALPQRRSWPLRVSCLICVSWVAYSIYIPCTSLPNIRICRNASISVSSQANKQNTTRHDPRTLYSTSSISPSNPSGHECSLPPSSPFSSNPNHSSDSDHLWTPCPLPVIFPSIQTSPANLSQTERCVRAISDDEFCDFLLLSTEDEINALASPDLGFQPSSACPLPNFLSHSCPKIGHRIDNMLSNSSKWCRASCPQLLFHSLPCSPASDMCDDNGDEYEVSLGDLSSLLDPVSPANNSPAGIHQHTMEIRDAHCSSLSQTHYSASESDLSSGFCS